MPIKIDIPDNQIDRLREIYTSLATEILTKMEKAQQEWADIQPTLAQLGIKISSGSKRIKTRNVERSADNFAVGNNYNANWNWTQKATYVLKVKGRPMTAKQILEVLLSEFEPNLDKATAANSLPSTLSVQARKNIFSRILDNGEYIYNLIEKENSDN